MPHPLVQISYSSPDMVAIISAFASLFAAGAAGFALYFARNDLKEARRQANARLTYQIQRDLLELMGSRSGNSDPREKTLFYFSMFKLMEAGALDPGMETMVRSDIRAAQSDSAFQEFWTAEGNRQDYPMEFQTFMNSIR